MTTTAPAAASEKSSFGRLRLTLSPRQ
uniref:Uncharacterized protein n=1 Tax=Arundo donax TaxID=35708 RepID=A0A0A8ZAD4_ARUDO